MHRVTVLGTGYVGLTTGACLASLGNSVHCVDIDAEKIDILARGQIPIVEAGLRELVQEGLRSGMLNFHYKQDPQLPHSEFVFLCLPTPQGADGEADISYLVEVVKQLRTKVSPTTIIVNKSTAPVGTVDFLVSLIDRDDVSVATCPEFLRQGSAVNDFLNPDRIVIGSSSEVISSRIAELFEPLGAPILKMDANSAELVKYAANSFLATKLTFINAVADICEILGADVEEVARGIGADPRIGREMLRAGPGWGGSCFPKDTRALIHLASNRGYDFSLLRGVVETNDSHYWRIVKKVVNACDGDVTAMNIAALGLTFKAGTDDLRDSPAISILGQLAEMGAKITSYDPTVKHPRKELGFTRIADSAEEACRDSDVILVLTEWVEFSALDPVAIARLVRRKCVVDARNLLEDNRWRDVGFSYIGVGR